VAAPADELRELGGELHADVLDYVRSRRRPCSDRDVSRDLAIPIIAARHVLGELERRGKVASSTGKGRKSWWRVTGPASAADPDGTGRPEAE
jgi:hypothetical protein